MAAFRSGRVVSMDYSQKTGTLGHWNWNTGKAARSPQHYTSIREQSIVGGESTGNKGRRGYASKPIDPTRSIEPLNPWSNSSSN
jgi:hypothetical protein